MSIRVGVPSNHLILCHPLSLPSSIFHSARDLSNESVLDLRWPNYWIFSFSSSPSNAYSGWITFRMDWFDLLAVQGTLTSVNLFVFYYLLNVLYSNSIYLNRFIPKTFL